MELGNGYRFSEIGKIPTDWEVKKFTDCAELKHGFQFRDEHFSTSGIIVTKIGNLIDGGGLDFSDVTYVPESDFKKFKRYIIYKDDVLMALTGATLGKVCKVDTNTVSLQNYRVGNFYPKSNTTKEYIFCILQSSYIQQRIKGLVNEAAQPNLGKQDFNKFIIPLPPTKAEQTAITNALSDTDALISCLEKLIAKKRNIKQGAMQELLKPKDGWENKKLGDFLDYEQPTPYLVADADYDDNNQTPVLTAGKTFILGYTNEENGIYRNLPVIIFDDFTTAIKYVDFPFKAKSSAMKMLVPKNDSVNLRFIYEIMQQIDYPIGIGDHKRHWIGEYRYLEITVPKSSQDQMEIAIVLAEMDAEISAIETKLEKYKMIKQGMMQTLLTGKIRLI
jgi:type I restriction enzyme S subunit